MFHVLHADLDAFYASVEQLDDPDLKGKPVVVGASPEGRGVVAAASYEARRFGIRSAMPMRSAMLRCPQVIRVQPRFERYRQASVEVMAIFNDLTPLVEPLSLDEAYLDITDVVTSDRSPGRIATELKYRVKSVVGLTISIGVATSKSVAKIASDMGKPDGLTIVPSGSERQFLAPLGVDKLWGIGPKTAARLAQDGVRTIGELALKSEGWWIAKFGNSGSQLRSFAVGDDDRPVVVGRDRKSVSAETTLAEDTGDADFLIEIIYRLSQHVARQLASEGIAGRTVKVKLRLSDFTTFTRQVTFSEPVDSAEVISSASGRLLKEELQWGRLFRLVGVGVSGFKKQYEQPLQLRLSGL